MDSKLNIVTVSQEQLNTVLAEIRRVKKLAALRNDVPDKKHLTYALFIFFILLTGGMLFLLSYSHTVVYKTPYYTSIFIIGGIAFSVLIGVCISQCFWRRAKNKLAIAEQTSISLINVV